MKRILSLSITIASLILLSAQIQAAELKIAYVDFQKVAFDSIAGKEAAAQLEKLKAEKQKDITKMQETLKKIEEEITLKGSTMKESAKLELQDRYESEYKKTNRYVKEAQEEMRKKEYSLLKPIQEELQTIINDYAKKNSLDFIFDKGFPGLLFSTEKLNISDEILKLYDEKTKQKPKGKK